MRNHNGRTAFGIADIVRDLLQVEHDRLVVDHFADDVNAECDGCRKASIIARTLATTIEIGTPSRRSAVPSI